VNRVRPELLRQIEIVPTDDGVFDQTATPSAISANLSLQELLIVDQNQRRVRTGAHFRPVQLFRRLAQDEIIDEAEQETRFWELCRTP